MNLSYLGLDIIYNIIDFISFELFIYLFPEMSKRRYNPLIHTYEWATLTPSTTLRYRIWLWLIDLEHIPKSSFAVNIICHSGKTYILQKLVFMLCENDKPLLYSENAIDWASAYGRLSTLEWFVTHLELFGLEIKYTHKAIDHASRNGYVHILDWWKYKYAESGLKLKYTKFAIDKTFSVQCLEWWAQVHQKYGLELKYSAKCIDTCRDTQMLDWWVHALVDYDIRLKYSVNAITESSAEGNIDILHWWFNRSTFKQTYLTLKYNELAIDKASANGHVHALDWWLKNWLEDRIPMKYTNLAIDTASKNGHVHILDWWFKHKQKGHVLFKRTAQAINEASLNGHVHVLDWWLGLYSKYNIPMIYSLTAIEGVLNRPHMIRWWFQTTQKYPSLFPEHQYNWNVYGVYETDELE